MTIRPCVERSDRLILYTAAELATRPPSKWLVRGVLREQSVTELYGRRGCYKSFVALDLAASIASNTPWQDHDIITPGLVVYVAGEGGGGMVNRIRAWSEHRSIDLDHVNMLFLTEPALVTATSDDMDLIIKRLKNAIEWDDVSDYCEDGVHTIIAREWPVLIILDTVARCFQGDENSTEDMGQFVQGVDRLKREFGCAVMLIHHSGKDETKGGRGSSALPGACDTIYKLEADKSTKLLTLTCEKMKDSAEPAPLSLGFKTVAVTRRELDDLEEDPTSVIIHSDFKQSRMERLLVMLRPHQSLPYGDWLGLSGLPKATFSRYLVELTKSGQIVKENDQWRIT